MIEIPFSKRPKARKSVLRRAALPMAVAALAAALALPHVAMAQTSQAAASNFCADSAVSLAFGNNIRVEPGAGPVSLTKASAILGGTMSKLEQMRSAQASGPSIAAAVTPHKTIISSECSRERAIFAAPGVTATAVAKDAVLGAQSVLIARRFNICAQLATKPLLTIWSRVSSKISIKRLIP